MYRFFGIAPVFALVLAWSGAADASETTITAPVLSVYEDGFRMADEKAQAVRVDAWTLCGVGWGTVF